MKIIQAGYQILTPISEGGIEELQKIELAARTCYKSEDKITPDGESAKKLVQHLIHRGHEAMLEHSQLSVRFICDRGVSHELVRHRLASFAQESTRYCNYKDDITFIEPCFWHEELQNYIRDGQIDWSSDWDEHIHDIDDHACQWILVCYTAEMAYKDVIGRGATPQEARTVLPNSLKTEVVMTANYREWRNIFKLRCAPDAHPQMREIMIPLCLELQEKIPIIFDDCYPAGGKVTERDEKGKPVAGRYPMKSVAEQRKETLEQAVMTAQKKTENVRKLRNAGFQLHEIAEILDIAESTVRLIAIQTEDDTCRKQTSNG